MLEEIKARHNQDELDMDKVSKGQLHTDRAYLLSIIESVEQELSIIANSENVGSMNARAEDALKAIRGE